LLAAKLVQLPSDDLFRHSRGSPGSSARLTFLAALSISSPVARCSVAQFAVLPHMTKETVIVGCKRRHGEKGADFLGEPDGRNSVAEVARARRQP
jgi:hypothetical protein